MRDFAENVTAHAPFWIDRFTDVQKQVASTWVRRAWRSKAFAGCSMLRSQLFAS
jgi:hypothetical protein